MSPNLSQANVSRPLDTLLTYHMDKSVSLAVPVRYAVRQVLDQEVRKEKLLQSSLARHARAGPAHATQADDDDEDKENQLPAGKLKNEAIRQVGAKRDFFGRVIAEDRPQSAGKGSKPVSASVDGKDGGRIWVSFHEGFSNAVRKPLTLTELLNGF
jgi:chromosome transmission fidelity protein 18